MVAAAAGARETKEIRALHMTLPLSKGFEPYTQILEIYGVINNDQSYKLICLFDIIFLFMDEFFHMIAQNILAKVLLLNEMPKLYFVIK